MNDALAKVIVYDEDGSPAFALRRIGKLHETGQGEQVDINKRGLIYEGEE